MRGVTFKIPRWHYLLGFLPIDSVKVICKEYTIVNLGKMSFHVTKGKNIDRVQTLILWSMGRFDNFSVSAFLPDGALQSNLRYLLDSVPNIPQYFNVHNFYNPDLWLKTYWKWQGRTP